MEFLRKNSYDFYLISLPLKFEPYWTAV